ncbi:unnamed protein product [Echinostoma caproni]|uniref:Retrovirus-related Pol polyprotein from transposon 17.6 n=1 Tax=Echinostoma caproni TaxID=27848 RepID=A0A183ART2_9TREM|nr:unnamed protein product [Echinostoma caproni]
MAAVLFECAESDIYIPNFGPSTNHNNWRRGHFEPIDSCSLENLNIHASACDVEDYLERFEIWCITQKELEGESKTAYFLTVSGKDAYSLLKSLASPDSPIALWYKSLETLLLKHLHPAIFEAAERAKFHSRGGRQPERDFILQFQTQAFVCNFGDQLQTQLRDRLIAGINYPKLQQKLLLIRDCTFQLSTAVCEQYQDVRAIICDEPNLFFNASNSKQSPSRRNRFFEKGSKTPSNVSSLARNEQWIQRWNKCNSCGQRHFRLSCRFRNTKCHNCVRECSKAKGGIKMTHMSPEVTGPPVRIIPLGLDDPVKKALDEMVSKGVLTPVNSSAWATPIVTLLKRDGKTPRI